MCVWLQEPAAEAVAEEATGACVSAAATASPAALEERLRTVESLLLHIQQQMMQQQQQLLEAETAAAAAGAATAAVAVAPVAGEMAREVRAGNPTLLLPYPAIALPCYCPAPPTAWPHACASKAACLPACMRACASKAACLPACCVCRCVLLHRIGVVRVGQEG